MIRALLVSSDNKAITDVKQTLRDFCPNVSLSGTAGSMQAGVSMINLNQPDILILCTRLSDGNSFGLLKHFTTLPPMWSTR